MKERQKITKISINSYNQNGTSDDVMINEEH